METNYIKVGIGVMILKDGKVLLGKRKGSHGAGEWSFPGGKLEYREEFEECAKRETKEECGITIKNIRFNFVANELQHLPKHFVQVGFVADWESGEPTIREPTKCDEWKWFDLQNLPEPIFAMSKLGIEAYKTGKNYFDNL